MHDEYQQMLLRRKQTGDSDGEIVNGDAVELQIAKTGVDSSAFAHVPQEEITRANRRAGALLTKTMT